MHPNRRYPYSIDFACFKKYLDRVAVVMVNSPMLARHLDHPPRRKSFPCILLQPLCALFSSAALSFQSLAASFPKTPGVGVPQHIRATHYPLLTTRSPLTTFRINTCEKQGEGGIRGKRTLPLTPRQPSLFCLLSGRCLSPVR